MHSPLNIRIGQGFDVHAFAAGRRLILGTVDIPYPLGLAGHSDADVLLHSVIDAILGALSWGDIGRWFPDNDESYRGIASSVLFERVWTKCLAERWQLVNCDVTVMAQEPKLSPHIERIRAATANLFGVDLSQISIKATTTEKLGFVGRKEGIAVSSVVLLSKND